MKYVSIPAKKCLAQRKNSSLPVTLRVFRYTLEGFIGAGRSKFVGLGIYGCADLATKINIIGTNSGLQSADLTGELAIKGYIGWVEAKRVFAHQTWHLYTANSVKSHSLLSGAAWDAAPEASAYAPSDLSYLAEESGWAPAAVQTYAARALLRERNARPRMGGIRGHE